MKSDLSKNLKMYREQFDYTQKYVADMLNISQRAYSFYETGNREPCINTLIDIANLYGVSIDVLVGHYNVKPSIINNKNICKKREVI